MNFRTPSFLLLLIWTWNSASSQIKATVFKTTGDKISFVYKNGGMVLNDATDKNTIFAMNGEMYMEGSYAPVGLYIENRKVIHKAVVVNNPNVNFGINPQAVFFIDTENRAGLVRVQSRNEKKYKYAVEIAPMLLEDGKVNPALSRFNGKCKYRNGVGITKEGQVVFILASTRTTFSDFATLFQENGCVAAAFIDGGISQCWRPGKENYGQFGVIVRSK